MSQNVKDPLASMTRATDALLGVADLLESSEQKRFAALLQLIALEMDEQVGEFHEEADS